MKARSGAQRAVRRQSRETNAQTAYRRRWEVNSTARWPERLEQVATLLRADGTAVLTLDGTDFRTVFAFRIEPDVSWSRLVGDDVLRKTLDSGSAVAVPVPAGRWGDTSAYALLAPIDVADGAERGLLCALRTGTPFDAVEIDAGRAAAALLTMAFGDVRARAEAERLLPIGEERHGDRRAIRVVIVEDHPAMRLGVRSLLEPNGFVVSATSATCAEALRRVAETSVDVVLLDLGLPDASGVEAIHRLRAAAPSLPILVFSVERSPELVRAALRGGASGYLAKDAPTDRLIAALRAAVAGLAVVSAESIPAVVRPTAAERGSGERASERGANDAPAIRSESAEPPAGPTEPLSPREVELLRYLAEGYTNKEIARVMLLAEDTVKKGVQSLIAKLGATDRTHAVVLALRNGLID